MSVNQLSVCVLGSGPVVCCRGAVAAGHPAERVRVAGNCLQHGSAGLCAASLTVKAQLHQLQILAPQLQLLAGPAAAAV